MHRVLGVVDSVQKPNKKVRAERKREAKGTKEERSRGERLEEQNVNPPGSIIGKYDLEETKEALIFERKVKEEVANEEDATVWI